jgi:hypothetical protein
VTLGIWLPRVRLCCWRGRSALQSRCQPVLAVASERPRPELVCSLLTGQRNQVFSGRLTIITPPGLRPRQKREALPARAFTKRRGHLFWFSLSDGSERRRPTQITMVDLIRAKYTGFFLGPEWTFLGRSNGFDLPLSGRPLDPPVSIPSAP